MSKQAPHTSPTDTQQLDAMSIAEFAKRHGLGRTTVHFEIKYGRLRSMKVGARRLITQEAAAEWRALCEREAAQAGEVA